jgi:hypothetical protein
LERNAGHAQHVRALAYCGDSMTKAENQESYPGLVPATEDTAKNIGNDSEIAGEAIAKESKTAGNEIAKAAKKTGKAIADAGKSVGKFFKNMKVKHFF